MRARGLVLVVVVACFDKPPRPGGDKMAGPDADTAVNVAFVTSTATVTLGLSGFTTLDSLDAICRTHAAAQSLPGTFVAWASDPSTNAITRLGSADGWKRTDDMPFVASRSDLLAGNIMYPLRIDEAKHDVMLQPDSLVATDTNADGTFAGVDCLKDSGNLTYGAPDGGTVTWTQNGASSSCVTPARLYCFQIDHHNAPPAASAVGRIAFLSDLKLRGDAGYMALDSECVTEAVGQNLGGDFQALIAFHGAHALDRFNGGEDWVRLDGVRFITGNKTSVEAPLDLTAKQVYVDELAWGGATSFFAMAANDGSDNCSDWTAGATTARQGRTSRSSATEGFGTASITACGLVAYASHVYCLAK